ncbi:uncharacterized protein [Hoplias malabaricus]|uniref:uncharacterized protein n=1 Tax=Hoplias malabaricus TaxID=27720 RepID=UPI00346353F7
MAGSKSDWFQVGVGLHQGCLLSPVLFIIFMDRIYRCSQVAEGVRFGGLRIPCLVFADDVVFLASSSRDLQLLLDQFAAECEAVGMRISTSKSESMVLSRKRVECSLQVGSETLPQVEEFKYLGVLFTTVCGVSAYTSYRYIFVNENKNWTEAQSYCRQNYTDLATINNMEEMKNLNTTLKDKTTSSVWIGLNRGNTGRWLWSLADGDKLVLVNLTLTWTDALRYCKENHTDLVSVHSKEVQFWVMEVAQKASTDHVWLGIRHSSIFEIWFWINGESICYQNWAPGNGTGGEDCGSVERCGAVESCGRQQWASLPETQQLNFICTNY